MSFVPARIVSFVGLVALIGAGVGAGMVFQRFAVPTNASAEKLVVIPTPKVPLSKLQTVYTPDGTKKIVASGTPVDSTTESYVVTTSDPHGDHRVVLYQTSEEVGTRLILPQNSWSPDNRYVFLIKNKQSVLTVLVFSADGKEFSESTPYINLSTDFEKRLPSLTLRDVTGWDDNQLLHVMTSDKTGQRSSSYWFDVPSRSFIQLSHY